MTPGPIIAGVVAGVVAIAAIIAFTWYMILRLRYKKELSAYHLDDLPFKNRGATQTEEFPPQYVGATVTEDASANHGGITEARG